MKEFKLPKKFPLIPRKKTSDKTQFGHVLVLAGSPGMTGAAILASRAAGRSGSGLVTLGISKSLEPRVAKSLVEVMQIGLPETKHATLSPSGYEKIKQFIQKRKVNSLAIGPGLSRDKETADLVRRIVCQMGVTTVLDADGINAFEGKLKVLKKRSNRLVLTPHRGEFERLFSVRWPESRSSRIRLAKKLSKFYDVVLVLKGPETLVVQDGQFYANKTGNPGLAKGGSGDVLTGVLASFVAQGLAPFIAAAWAVHYHGRAADLAVKDKSQIGLLAGDVIEFLPKAFSLV